MKRLAKVGLSAEEEKELGRFVHYPRHGQDLTSETISNYLSDIRRFAA